MSEVLEAKGIAREALAALTLFCEAARQETATVELVERVIGEVERGRGVGARLGQLVRSELAVHVAVG